MLKIHLHVCNTCICIFSVQRDFCCSYQFGRLTYFCESPVIDGCQGIVSITGSIEGTGSYLVLCSSGGVYKILGRCKSVQLVVDEYLNRTDGQYYLLRGEKILLWDTDFAVVLMDKCNLIEVNEEARSAVLIISNPGCSDLDTPTSTGFDATKIENVADMVKTLYANTIYIHSGPTSKPLRIINRATRQSKDGFFLTDTGQTVHHLALNQQQRRLLVVSDDGFYRYDLAAPENGAYQYFSMGGYSDASDGPYNSTSYKFETMPVAVDASMGRIVLATEDDGSVRVIDDFNRYVSSLCSSSGSTDIASVKFGHIDECQLPIGIKDIFVDPSFDTLLILYDNTVFSLEVMTKTSTLGW